MLYGIIMGVFLYLAGVAMFSVDKGRPLGYLLTTFGASVLLLVSISAMAGRTDLNHPENPMTLGARDTLYVIPSGINHGVALVVTSGPDGPCLQVHEFTPGHMAFVPPMVK